MTLIVGQLVSTPADDAADDDHDGHDDATDDAPTTTTPADAARPRREPRAASRRVAVLSGGRSSEHEVSVASARSVADALAAAGWTSSRSRSTATGALGARPRARRSRARAGRRQRAVARLPDRSVAGALGGVDVVFPVLHGPFGEDGTVQGLLELAGVPYVGAGRDRLGALHGQGPLQVGAARQRHPGDAQRDAARRRRAAERRTAIPVFVKPARLGSSVGISKAHDDAELAAAVALAFEHDEKVLVEEFVDGHRGRGRRARQPRRRRRRSRARSWSRTTSGTTTRRSTSRARWSSSSRRAIARGRRARAQELAVRAFVAAECEGMARVDLFVRRDGEVLVNELNTIPGFTADERLREALRGERASRTRACSSG